MLKKYVIAIAVIAALAFIQSRMHHAPPATGIAQGSGDEVENAFTNARSGVVVTAEGTVERTLADDTKGDRHQRFIVRLPSGRTLLVAHNIDAAPRVPGIAAGSVVKFHGQYEWSDKGGTVHWTHRDHRGSHEAGWIEFNGQRYD